MSEEGEAVTDWRKSSRSDSGGCVEVRIEREKVLVRDTKDRSGPLLVFTHHEWRAFLDGVRLGEFDIQSALTAL